MDIVLFGKFIGSYAAFLVVFGTLSNFLTFLVCLRKNLKKTPTFVFLAFCCVTDTIPLFVRNVDNFSNLCLGYRVRATNEFSCKTNLFFHFFPLQTSAWLLTSMNLERYLSIKVRNWSTKLFNSKKATILCSIIVAIFISINLCLLTSPSLEYVKTISNNKTTIKTNCNDGVLYSTWLIINLFLYSLIPFAILLIVNALLIYGTISQKSALIVRSQRDITQRRSLSLAIMISTLFYILLTAPHSIFTSFFPTQTYTTGMLNLVQPLLSSIRFSNHSFKIITLFFINKRFKSELRNLIFYKPNNRVSTTTVQ